MARSADKKTFQTNDGPAEVTITQLGGIDASLLLIKITKRVGPLIGGVILANDAVKIGEALAMLDGAEFEAILLELLKGAQVKHKNEIHDLDRDAVNDVFRGRVDEIAKLAAYAFEVNFGPFSAALAGAFKKGGKAEEMMNTIAKVTGSAKAT